MKNMRKIAIMLVLVMALAIVGGAASYTVQSGDVLWRIARDFGTDYMSLAEANGIDNPNLIFPGQVITWGEAAEPTPEPTPEPEANMLYGTAKGYGGDLTVMVTMDGDKIAAIEVTEHKETNGIGTPAIDMLPAKMVEGSTVMVDTLAGATLTSNAIIEAVKAALTAGGYNAADYEVEVTVDAGDMETIEKSADVVVIGAGGAGLSAAVEVLRAEGSVIVLEKMAAVGGNTIRAGSAMNTANPLTQEAKEMPSSGHDTIELILGLEPKDDMMAGWQETLQEEYDAYLASGETHIFDSPSFHKIQTYYGGDYVAKPELIDVYADNSLGAYTFLEDLGTVWLEDVNAAVGATWTRSHTPDSTVWGAGGAGFVLPQADYVGKNGGEILLNHTATEIIMKDGMAVGVKGETSDGQPFEIMADKGVLVATGGFGASIEMREKYNVHWPVLDETIPTTNHPGATGDGIVMAEAVGAGLFGMEWIQIIPTYGPGVFTAYIENQFYINKEGDRFVKEDGRRDELASAILEQTDGEIYIISDGNTVVDGKTSNGRDIDGDRVGNGYVYKADTLEELAEMIDVPAQSLLAAVEQHNAGVRGEGDPFGRAVYDQEFGVPPYYAGLTNPMVHHTMGGVDVNTDMEVLDTEGNVIDGLWAAGEVIGGLHGSNRLGGNAITDVTVFGRIAGQNIMAQ